MGARLGELEQLLLMAVMRNEGTASGIEIAEEVRSKTGRVVLPGAIYTVMERLRARELVTSHTGDKAPERGGRPRKYYSLTPAGELELAASYSAIENMAAGIKKRLSELSEGA